MDNQSDTTSASEVPAGTPDIKVTGATKPKVDFKLKDPRSAEDQLAELKMLIAVQHRKINQLTEGTPFSDIEAPEEDIFKTIEEDAKSYDFWSNYKTYSPIMMCFCCDKDPQTSGMRDNTVTSEILKSLSILNILSETVKSHQPNEFDLFEYTHAMKVLEDKIDVIEALKAPTADPKFMRVKIRGTDKVMKIDVAKLHESLTYSNTDGTPEPVSTSIAAVLSEDDEAYLIPKIEEYKASHHLIDHELLDHIPQDSMIDMMKMIADFAKMKFTSINEKAQKERLEFYLKNDDEYLDIIRKTLTEEELNYNFCTNAVLSRLEVTKEMFQKTERDLMMDPIRQMELLEKGIETENDDIEIPEDLTKKRTITIIKEANDISFEKFKELHNKIMAMDPMLIPVVISCLSHDYITKKYEYDEIVFKACMFNHKVFDDPELAKHMQVKQMEMMQLQAPMMGGPGGMPGMMPQGMPSGMM